MKTLSCGHECESLPVSDAAKEAESETRKVYPTLYLSDIKGLEDVPDTGEMTIKFRRKSKTVSEHTEDGEDETEVSVSLEIESITFDDTKGDEVSTSTEPSLEDLFNQSVGESDES